VGESTIDVTAGRRRPPWQGVVATSGAVLWTLAMIAAFWSPPPPQPRWRWEWIDETVHLSSFLVFAIAWSIAGTRWRPIALVGLALAAITELVQPLLPWHRTAQLGDAIADALGLGLGLALIAGLRALRHGRG
jgi:VanZ family protein